MSAQRPPDPGDRPRMAEALASLKEGLRDTADPLYDGWKRRPKPAPVDAPLEANTAATGPLPPIAPPPFIPRFKPLLAAQPGITIDLSRDGTPEQTPIGDVEVTIDDDFDDPERTRDFATDEEDAFFAQGQAMEMPSAPPVVRRSSVQADTVRVRVIRYPSFPRWALVVAAALVLFALVVLTLRPTWSGDDEEALAVGEVTDQAEATQGAAKAPDLEPAAAPLVASAPTSKFEPPVFVAEPDIEAENEDLAAAAANDEKIAEKAERSAPAQGSARPAMGHPTVAPIGSAVQVRIPAATRRRSGSRDFFRDPGF